MFSVFKADKIKSGSASNYGAPILDRGAHNTGLDIYQNSDGVVRAGMISNDNSAQAVSNVLQNPYGNSTLITGLKEPPKTILRSTVAPSPTILLPT